MTDEPPITDELAKPAETESFDARLVEVLDQYMSDRRNGISPSHDDLLAQHPELADQLKSCLEGIDLLGSQSADLGTRQQLGDFQLREEIGRGGMGVVYEAFQPSLNRTVALKVLNLPITDTRVMERFQREAATAAGLHHTNIVPIYEVGDDNGTHFYAMQLIEGSSLSEVLRDAGQPLDLDKVAQWGLQAAEALAYAHAHDVIHRDIKPSNLILDPDGQIWLTDFGLARRLDDVRLSATGAVLGTPRYMSPEQASAISHPVDARTDIYSLGATLYELVCDQPAVDGATPVAVINSIVKDHPRSPREHRPSVSRDLETILLRCLQKHPTDRYASAAELASDLRALTEGRPISSRPMSAFERTRRWLSQHQVSVRWAAAGGLAAIALLCVGVWFALVYPTLDDAQVQLNTTVAGLRADFQRLDGDSATVSVNVPTTEPITLDEGQWKARLLRPGGFSHEVRHWFHRGDDRGLLLPPPPPPLWSTENIIASYPFEIDGRINMIVTTENSIERRDITTGEVVWRRDSQLDEIRVTNSRGTTHYDSGWGHFPNTPASSFQAAPICAVGQPGSQTEDVDGDGVPDLLIAGHKKPAVLALSGADGSTLWKGLYASDIGVEPSASGVRCVWINALDGDQPLAIFCSNRGATPEAWIVQLDSFSGALQWKAKLAFAKAKYGKYAIPQKYVDRVYAGSERTPSMNMSRYTFVQQIDRHQNWIGRYDMVPLVVPLAKHQILCLLDRDVIKIDRRDGTMTKMADLLAGSPVQPIQPVKLGEGKLGYLVAAQVTVADSLDDDERLNLRLYDASFENLLWQKVVRADGGAPVCGLTDAPVLPLVADLNHDGRDEVITQVDRVDLPMHHFYRGTVWADLQILGSDGSELLTEPMRVFTADAQVLHVQVLSDADNDGWDDLAVASRYAAMRDDRGSVHVELFSGNTGKVIWHQQIQHPQTAEQNAPPEIAQFRCEHVGGRMLLLVETVTDSGFFGVANHETAFLYPSTGQVFTIGDRLSIQSIIDSTSAGSLLWCCDRTDPQLDRGEDKGGDRYKMFTLPLDEVINASQRAQVTADIDGDGMLDLRVHRASRGSFDDGGFVSSKNGNLLPFPKLQDDSVELFATHQDLSGNGRTDFISCGFDEPIRLVEGATGREVWTLSRSMFADHHGILAIAPASLTGSGSKDLIIALYAELAATPTFGLATWKKPLLVVGARGSDGEVLWLQDYGPVPSTGGYETLHHAHHDLNEDGFTDFAFTYFDEFESAAMFAIDGQTGKRMWELPGVYNSRPDWLDRFPAPLVVDGEQPKIATITLDGTKNRGYRFCVIDAQSGRLTFEKKIPSRRSYRSSTDREGRWGRHAVIPLRSAQSNQQLVAFWIVQNDGKTEIHVGDIQSGRFEPVAEPWAVDGEKPRYGAWYIWFRMLAADVDGDGNDELLLPNPSGLGAYTLDGRSLWNRRIDGLCAALESVRKLGEINECVYSVPGLDKRMSVAGIDVRDGSRRWHVRGRPSMRLIGSQRVRGMLDETSVLPTFAYADEQRYYWMTKKAEPAKGLGLGDVVAEPSGKPAMPKIDTRTLGAGPYPAGSIYSYATPWRFSGKMLWSVIWALVVFVIPVLLLIHVLRKRTFSLSLMMLATAVVAAAFASLTIPVGNQVLTIGDRITMGLWITPFFIWIGLAVAFYRRGQPVGWVSLLLSPFVLLLLWELQKAVTLHPERIVLPSDLLRLWRGLLIMIPIVIMMGGPIWVPVWYSNHKRKSLRAS